MIANGSITLYSYDENSGTYTPCQYRNVSIYMKNASAGSNYGYSGRGGFTDSNVCTVRIPTSAAIDISCDDYVYPGLAAGAIDKSKCLKVVSFSDNRRGSLKHWRIDCR